MITEHYGIITFNSTHHAIASEKHLQNTGFSVRIIPVPTQVTADCGLAIRFDLDAYTYIVPQLQDMDDAKFYKVSVEGRTKKVTAF